MIIIIAMLIISTVVFLFKKESDKERDELLVEALTIISDKIKKTYRFAFLSDLHDKEFGENNERLIKCVSDIRPDAVLIGGDMLNVRKKSISMTTIKTLIFELKKIAPICYANGNNEQRLVWETEDFADYKRQFDEILDANDVIYLEDTFVDVDEVRIFGLNLELNHYHEFVNKPLDVDFINDAIGSPDIRTFNLLLCHSPMFFNTYIDWGADLTLTGHSHGGIVRFPTDKHKIPGQINNDRGLVSGQYQLFHKYCAGVFKKNNQYMVVSRGLGTHTVNVRINNKPQVVVIELNPAD